MSQLSITDVLVPSSSLITAGSAQPFQRLNLYLAESKIQRLDQKTPGASAEVLEGARCFALPGFIDLHVHGGMGADTMDATPDALTTMAKFFVQNGVTSFCPTTMTAPLEQILNAVKNVATAAPRYSSTLGARMLGIHVEGPYISPSFPGAQPAEYIRRPKLDEFRALLAAGPVALITLAPEIPGAAELIKLARNEGVVAVIGHTDATYEDCVAAVEQGATQATHTYNAMSGLHHRRPGTLGAVLSLDEIDAQLIADNIHVHRAAMKILSRCKGPNRTILITDAMRAAGLDEGDYTLGGQKVSVKEGACRLEDGTLAGSILTMDQALRNFMTATGLSLDQAWAATSRNAARSLGMDDKLGSIGEGYWADIVLLDERYHVVATIVGGEIVYLRDSERLN